MLREEVVSVNQLIQVVKENSLDSHFKDLKSKALFEKFLLLPNKKEDMSDQQKKTLEEYEATFFGRYKNFSDTTKTRYKQKKEHAKKELHCWEQDKDYKRISNKGGPEKILTQMIDLLFYTVTEISNVEKELTNEELDDVKLEENVKVFSEFLSKIFEINDLQFNQRLHLMFLLAIKQIRGYQIAKPVWLRKKADKWGSKFVLRKKNTEGYDYITIMDGEIDRSKLKEGQTIGFNTHHTATLNDQHIPIEEFLDLHILETPTLAGDELEEVFEKELKLSIAKKKINSTLKKIISAMFRMYHEPQRVSLKLKKTAEISDFGAENGRMIYPRVFAPQRFDEVKDVFDRAPQGLSLEDIVDMLVFTKVRVKDTYYFWAHCDEWARNCFILEDRKQLNWLDFEDSVYIRDGSFDSEEIEKNGGRCWNRLTSGDNNPARLEFVHLNAISSFARLFTATLQFYSVNDIYREEGKLENYPDIIGAMFEDILGNLEEWANSEKKEITPTRTIENPELLNPKIKIQFLLACYDWAIHWDNHGPDKSDRSWSKKEDNTVFNHFKETVIENITKLLKKQEKSNKKDNLNKEKNKAAKEKEAEDEKQHFAYGEEQIEAYMTARNLKQNVEKLMAEKPPLGKLIEYASLRSIDNCIEKLQYFLIRYDAELHTGDSSEIRDIDEIFREYESIFINDVLLQHYDSRKRSYRKEVYRLLNHCLLRRGILDLHINNEISDEWKNYFKQYSFIFNMRKDGKNQIVNHFLILRMNKLGSDVDIKKLDEGIIKELDKSYERKKLSVNKMIEFMDDASQRDSSKPDFFLE